MDRRKAYLEPCPSCGCKADMFHIPENTPEEQALHPKWRWNNPGKWVVGCQTPRCPYNIDRCNQLFSSMEEAVEAWNKLPRESYKGRVCVECIYWELGRDDPGHCIILARTGWCFSDDRACESFEPKQIQGRNVNG